jgi:hypothetical protein
MRYEFTAKFVYELPDGEDRNTFYGTQDPFECMKIDMETDPAYTMLNLEGFDIISAEVLG